MSTLTTVGRHKNVNQRCKDIVNGFIQRIQQLFPSHITFYNIPRLINYVCIAFYYPLDEIDKKCIGDKIEMIDSITMKNNGNDWNSVFGVNVCKPLTGLYEWRITIIDCSISPPGNAYNITIGIVDENLCDKLKNKFMCNTITEHKNKKRYMFIGSSSEIYTPKQSRYAYGKPFQKKGDILCMCFDTDKMTLSYKINGTSYGKAFDIEPENYRFTMSLWPGRTVRFCDPL